MKPSSLTPLIPELPQCNTNLLPHPSTSLLTPHSSHPTTTLMISCISLHPSFNPYSINPLSLIRHLLHPSHHLAPSTLYLTISQAMHLFSIITTPICPRPSSILIPPQSRPSIQEHITDSLFILSLSALHFQTISTLLHSGFFSYPSHILPHV